MLNSIFGAAIPMWTTWTVVDLMQPSNLQLLSEPLFGLL